jgi:drug/metabolite transporter (DMT)-like permease
LGVPYLFYFLGLRRLRAQVASIVALLEPVTGVLIGIFVYREVPDLPGFLGILLVLLSIFLVTRRKPRPRVD